MARYRIGNDMTILWTVNDRDGKALPLTDKEVHLYYTCERGRFEADIEIQDNVVAWNFLGSKQRVLGDYTLTLEVLQSNGKRVIKRDICNAFTLVGKGCEGRHGKEDGEINDGGVVELVSELEIFRISPVVPVIEKANDGIEYWFVDGVNTGKSARGEKGDVVDASYMVFDVDENMDLNLTFLSTNDQLELDFNIDENGYLTVDK